MCMLYFHDQTSPLINHRPQIVATSMEVLNEIDAVCKQ